MPIIIKRIYRIGVQTVEYTDGQWWITITNRTYRSKVQVTEEIAKRYIKAMKH